VTDGPGTPPTFDLRTIGPEPAGASLLEEEELKALIPDFVATRADLNQVEYEKHRQSPSVGATTSKAAWHRGPAGVPFPIRTAPADVRRRVAVGGNTRIRVEKGSALRLGDSDYKSGARKDPSVHRVEEPE
jgi:hypothetical protein